MLTNFYKLVTPTLARVLGAIALIVAVCWFGKIGAAAVEGQAPGLRQSSELVAGLATVGGEHRLVTITNRDNAKIVCSEGPRQLQRMAEPSPKRESGRTPAASSTIYLREAGWQLCSAYANGLIDKAKYGELLTAVINKK